MNDSELMLQDIKYLLKEQLILLQVLLPKQVPISQLCIETGKSRQAMREYLIRNFEPEIDFWKDSGIILVTRDTAIAILQRS